MQLVLASLKDIRAVVGSLVLAADGSMPCRDLPALFDDDTLRYVGKRLTLLRSALEADTESFESSVARFGAHLLVLRAAADRTLCVLAGPNVNLQALHMGTRIVARRVTSTPTHSPTNCHERSTNRVMTG